MKRVLRWAGYVLATLVLLVLLTGAAVWVVGGWKLDHHAPPKPEHLSKPTAAQIEDAGRQFYVLRCADCHEEGLRGDLFFHQKNVATVYAPNLTQVAAHATDEQLARAIRQGIGVDGRSLVIMPSGTFARLDDSEVAALIDAVRALPPVGRTWPPREVNFLGRLGLVTGKFHTSPEQVADYARKLPLDLGSRHAPGRHLAASNCAECHGGDLGGGEAEPGLNAPDLTVVGAYDPAAFRTLLRTGVPPGGRKLKLMSDVARQSLSHLTDAEIEQMYEYLQERAQRLSH